MHQSVGRTVLAPVPGEAGNIRPRDRQKLPGRHRRNPNPA
jgi:hypothetical protein